MQSSTGQPSAVAGCPGEIYGGSSAGQGALVLHGDDKRFVVSPPATWSGRQKPEAFGMFRRKLEELGVVFYPSNVAGYKINRNVRVRE